VTGEAGKRRMLSIRYGAEGREARALTE